MAQDCTCHNAPDGGSCSLSLIAHDVGPSKSAAPLGSDRLSERTLLPSFSYDACFFLYLFFSFLIAVVSFSLMLPQREGFHSRMKNNG